VSDHTLTQISTWTEVGILVFMFWERYGPLFTGGSPMVTEQWATRHVLLGRLWDNRTLIVALGGLLFIGWLNFWREPQDAGSHLSLSVENARLDVWKIERSFNDHNQVYVNLSIANNGKIAASDFRHLGIVPIGNGESIPEAALASIFLMLHGQLAVPNPAKSANEIYPGQNTFWYTELSLPLDAQTFQDVKNGQQIPYVMALLKYRDASLPPDKYVYTEVCVYFVKEVAHYCEGGHNSSYVAN
jgi:hypothetical protein